jgi:hypothetical protein
VQGLRHIRWSVAAFVASAVLAVLAMGALGGALYLAVAPLVPGAPASIDQLSGDWVWPAMIVTGLAWSPSWLLAGALAHRLRVRAAPLALRVAIYAAVLWLAAWLVWSIALATR